MSRVRSLRWAVALVVVGGVFAATAVGVFAHASSVATQNKTVTIAFIYDSPHNDAGWSQGHDAARQAMEKALHGKVKTLYLESVPYGKQMLNDWNQLVSRGVTAIVDTSAAGQPFVNFCKAHPTLVCATTYPPLGPEPKNVSNFYVAHWLGSYLVGVAAGKLTKNGTVGYVAPFKVPTVNASVNAFALGCQSVRKDCTVKTVLVNSWYDPPKETEAAKTLLNGGADVLYGLTDDPAYENVAAKQNVWTFGSYQDAVRTAGKTAGKWYVTGVVWDWAKIYTDFARGLVDGTWKSGRVVVGPLGTGTGIRPALGSNVPASVKSTVEKAQAQLEKGMNPFKGPLYDQSGKVRVKAGQPLSPGILLNNWTWLVKGVVSS